MSINSRTVTEGIVAGVPTTQVVTYFEVDAHIVEEYREPYPEEAYDAYEQSGNAWRIIGFGSKICDSDTVDDKDVTKWREFFADVCLITPEIDAVFKLIWPDWFNHYGSD